MREEPPQTILEARYFGWQWLRVVCIGCGHRGSVNFFDLQMSRAEWPIALYISRMVCSVCRSKEFEVSLGMRTKPELFSVHVPIAFEGYKTIPRPR